MSHSDHCVGCLKSFKRLLTHLAQNAVCALHYAAHDNSAPAVLSIPNYCHLNTSHALSEGATRSHPNVRSSSFHGLLLGKESCTSSGEADNELHVEDVNEFEDDFVVDEDAFSNVHVDDQSLSGSEKEECQADHSVENGK